MNPDISYQVPLKPAPITQKYRRKNKATHSHRCRHRHRILLLLLNHTHAFEKQKRFFFYLNEHARVFSFNKFNTTTLNLPNKIVEIFVPILLTQSLFHQQFLNV